MRHQHLNHGVSILLAFILLACSCAKSSSSSASSKFLSFDSLPAKYQSASLVVQQYMVKHEISVSSKRTRIIESGSNLEFIIVTEESLREENRHKASKYIRAVYSTSEGRVTCFERLQ